MAGFVLCVAPSLIASPVAMMSDREEVRIQLTATVADTEHTSRTLLYRYTCDMATDDLNESRFVVLDPGQPKFFHFISTLDERNLSLESECRKEGNHALIEFVADSLLKDKESCQLIITVIVAVTDKNNYNTNVYEGLPIIIDVNEIAFVEKKLGYRCRTRKTATLDSNHNVIEVLQNDTSLSEEGPSFGFSVQVTGEGASSRLKDFLTTFSPDSEQHADDIVERMSEEEVFCRLRSRYRLTCYRERLLSFLYWYRVREIISANGAGSWALPFLISPPESDTGSNETIVSSQASIFRRCRESAQYSPQSWGYRFKQDTELCDTLMMLWRHREYELMCRLAMLLGPEPFLFDPKSRLQQVFATEIRSLLDGVAHRQAVEYSLQNLISQSPLVMDAWKEALEVLPSRISLAGDGTALSRVFEGKQMSVDCLTSELPSSPTMALTMVRPSHGAVFMRQQLRVFFSPRGQTRASRYESTLCDVYAWCCPYMMLLEIFLMALEQKKDVTHQSPVLWRKMVDMPDHLDLHAPESERPPIEVLRVATPTQRPMGQLAAEMDDAAAHNSQHYNDDVRDHVAFRGEAFVSKETLADSKWSFISTARSSEEYREWADSCRGYSELTATNHSGLILIPKEVVLVENDALSDIFRSHLVSLTEHPQKSDSVPSVKRFVVAQSGSMVEAINAIQIHGHGALDFKRGFQSDGWILSFSDPSYTVESVANRRPGLANVMSNLIPSPDLVVQTGKTAGSLEHSHWFFAQHLSGTVANFFADGLIPLSDISNECSEFPEPAERVYAVCDVIVPSEAAAPSPLMRLATDSSELLPLVSNCELHFENETLSPHVIGGRIQMDSAKQSSFFGLFGNLIKNVTIRALVRCQLFKVRETEIPCEPDAKSPSESPVPLPEKSEQSRDEEFYKDQSFEKGSQSEEESFEVVEREIDLEKVGKVAALFRSASGASDYLDDGRSELEVLPAQALPSQKSLQVLNSPTASLEVRKVAGLDRYRKDGYAGVVPRRLASSRSRIVRSAGVSQRCEPYSPEKIPSVNASVVLGPSQASVGLPLTSQEERMLVRSAIQKRDFSVEHQRLVSSVEKSFQDQKSNSTARAQRKYDASDVRHGLRFSYDASKGSSIPRSRSTGRGLADVNEKEGPRVGVFAQPIANRGALSRAAMGLFSHARKEGTELDTRFSHFQERDWRDTGEAVLATHHATRIFGHPSTRSERSSFIETMSNADYLLPTNMNTNNSASKVSRPNRSSSRAATEVDEHGVPYRLYDEISRSPSVIAGHVASTQHHLANNHMYFPERSFEKHYDPGIGVGAHEAALEPLEASRPATVVDVFVAAGGEIGGVAPDIGQRALSRRSRLASPSTRASVRSVSRATSDPLAHFGAVRGQSSAQERDVLQTISASSDAISGNYVYEVNRNRYRTTLPRTVDPHASDNARAVAPSAESSSDLRKLIERGWATFREGRDSDGALSLWTRAMNEGQFMTEGAEAEGIIAEVFEGNVFKARSLFEKASRIDPKNHHALYRLGHLLESEGDISQAARIFGLASALGNFAASKKIREGEVH